jgi:broad specificity phosphatase PhoE
LAVKTIYLVRHGQYISTSLPGEVPDGALTELGREQTALVAKRLKNFPIKVIHHSPLKRSIETAALIMNEFPAVELQPSPLLEECIPCLPPETMLNENQKAFFASLPASILEQGESQARQVFETYFLPGGSEEVTHELIVSHGNLICYLVCMVLKSGPETWINTDIQNCGLSEVVVRADGTMQLVCHNDTGHLPLILKTWV